MPAGAQQLTPQSGSFEPDAGRSWRREGVRAGPGKPCSPHPNAPSAHLTVLQEGEEPLQLCHQGLGVVFSQAEHTVSEASNETGAQGKLRPQGAAFPLYQATRDLWHFSR